MNKLKKKIELGKDTKMFLRVWGFQGSFSYKNLSFKKNVYCPIEWIIKTDEKFSYKY